MIPFYQKKYRLLKSLNSYEVLRMLELKSRSTNNININVISRQLSAFIVNMNLVFNTYSTLKSYETYSMISNLVLKHNFRGHLTDSIARILKGNSTSKFNLYPRLVRADGISVNSYTSIQTQTLIKLMEVITDLFSISTRLSNQTNISANLVASILDSIEFSVNISQFYNSFASLDIISELSTLIPMSLSLNFDIDKALLIPFQSRSIKTVSRIGSFNTKAIVTFAWLYSLYNHDPKSLMIMDALTLEQLTFNKQN